MAGREGHPVFVFDMARRRGPTCGNNFTSSSSSTRAASTSSTIWTPPGPPWRWGDRGGQAPVIVIDDYGDTTLEERSPSSRRTLPWPRCPPFQNDRIISVTLCEVFASSMTGDTVEKFARAFHPDCFA